MHETQPNCVLPNNSIRFELIIILDKDFVMYSTTSNDLPEYCAC